MSKTLRDQFTDEENEKIDRYGAAICHSSYEIRSQIIAYRGRRKAEDIQRSLVALDEACRNVGNYRTKLVNLIVNKDKEEQFSNRNLGAKIGGRKHKKNPFQNKYRR